MMGMPISPEMRAQLDEQVRKRKEKVAASLGKTLEEFDAAQRCCGGHDHEHAHDDNCACGQAGADAHAAADACEVPEVDERAVLDFIHSRQTIIEQQRGRIRALEAQVKHLESQKALEEKKCATLREALAKLRAELKAKDTEDAPQA